MVDYVSIIEVFNLTELFTWVDASYTVKSNMRIHTGGVMSTGYEMLYCQPSKQNPNAKSLSEAKLIGTSAYLSFNV